MPQEILQKGKKKGEISLQFGAVQGFFAAYLGLPKDRVETRIRLLRRSGVPMVDTLGSGPVKQYGLRELMQLAFAMEFVEEGVSLAEAATIVTRFWKSHLAAVPDRAWRMNSAEKQDSLLVILHRTGFRGWSEEHASRDWSWISSKINDQGYTDEHALTVELASDFAKSDFFAPRLKLPLSFGRHRAYVINCSKMAHGVAKLLAQKWLIDAGEAEMLYRYYRPSEDSHM